MPTIHDLKQSRFLTQADVEKPILVTIKSYTFQNVAPDGQPKDDKYVLHFHETDKPLVLNFTNGDVIAQINGSEDFANWPGTKIVLFRDPNIMMGTQKKGGIRVRAPRNIPAQAKKQEPPKPQPQPEPEPEPDFTDVTAPPDDDVPF